MDKNRLNLIGAKNINITNLLKWTNYCQLNPNELIIAKWILNLEVSLLAVQEKGKIGWLNTVYSRLDTVFNRGRIEITNE